MATTELHTDLIAPRLLPKQRPGAYNRAMLLAIQNEIMAVTYTSEGLTRPSGTITAQKPFFCVVLSGGGQWHVQAEWPDGTIEQIDAFKAHLEGVNWCELNPRCGCGSARTRTPDE